MLFYSFSEGLKDSKWNQTHPDLKDWVAVLFSSQLHYMKHTVIRLFSLVYP
jgi:hypothetical protein